MQSTTAIATLRWFAIVLVASILAAMSATSARAATGLTVLPASGNEGPVTVYYPTDAVEQPVRQAIFMLSLAPDAPPVRGNGRLIVISHGSGGSPWVHADLARVLVADGFIVAMPEHHADNYKDPSHPGPDSWKLRPAEVSRAIDRVAQDARFAPLLSFDRVGMYGMSAGGHTALSLAGGRWSPARFRDHCEAHIAEDFPACVGLLTRLRGNFLDGIKKAVATFVIRQQFDDATWYTHDEPRIKAIVAGVPVAADFDKASLVAPQVPLGLITAGQDKWLAPRFHSSAVLLACKTCERIADLPDAGHGALLSPPPPMEHLGPTERALLGDPEGFDRAVMTSIDFRIAAFFRRHLLP